MRTLAVRMLTASLLLASVPAEATTDAAAGASALQVAVAEWETSTRKLYRYELLIAYRSVETVSSSTEGMVLSERCERRKVRRRRRRWVCSFRFEFLNLRGTEFVVDPLLRSASLKHGGDDVLWTGSGENPQPGTFQVLGGGVVAGGSWTEREAAVTGTLGGRAIEPARYTFAAIGQGAAAGAFIEAICEAVDCPEEPEED